MAAIEVTPLDVRPESLCAAEGVTYAFNAVEGLTFGELLLAVSIERTSALEHLCVSLLNRLEEQSQTLEVYTAAAQAILDGATPDTPLSLPEGYDSSNLSETPTLYDWLTEACGFSVSQDTWSFSERMAIYDDLKTLITPLTTQSQEILIDLQTALSNRETAANLATVGIKRQMQTALNTVTAY